MQMHQVNFHYQTHSCSRRLITSSGILLQTNAFQMCLFRAVTLNCGHLLIKYFQLLADYVLANQMRISSHISTNIIC